MRANRLREIDGEQINHQHHQHNSPDQRLQCCHDLVHQCPPSANKADDPDDADDPDQTRDAGHAEDSDLAGAVVVVQMREAILDYGVCHRSRDDERVEQIPIPRLRIEKELLTVDADPQAQLEGEHGRVAQADHPKGADLGLGVSGVPRPLHVRLDTDEHGVGDDQRREKQLELRAVHDPAGEGPLRTLVAADFPERLLPLQRNAARQFPGPPVVRINVVGRRGVALGLRRGRRRLARGGLLAQQDPRRFQRWPLLARKEGRPAVRPLHAWRNLLGDVGDLNLQGV
mmetsp:Transcript_63962/g.195614  ORF Transcript_63962/g.195614 Transcript_63962/m.195614 type:complete len:286 (+) Transcript_63962:691-1548(+)